MTQDLLIEIGCEDLPARYLRPLAEALRDGLREGLASRGLACASAESFATPRRIAALLRALPDRQPDQQQSRKGPSLQAAFRDGEPTRAAEGFARSCGVALEALAQEDGYLLYRATVAGQATPALLPEVFTETLARMDQLVPKRMRWGSGEDTFVRPVQWLLARFGDAVVPLQAFALQAQGQSYGHRFHAPGAVDLARPSDYAEALRAARVAADMDARMADIRTQVQAAAAAVGGSARITEALLEEVAALVEWPVAVRGAIEPRFLVLPPEVIVATVETNQRYFTVFDADGSLLPHFITVANIVSRDPAQVVAGNERVVRPRLADALFFWEQDRARPLQDYLPRLQRATFHKALGSIADKAARVERLAEALAVELAAALAAEGVDAATVRRAAQLAKADLATQMVFEFPELQGVMGGYYARAAGEAEAVAAAIAEHYQPTGAGAAIPATAAGRVLALADRLDTLAGLFAAGQPPTASKDPFALRRAAIGVLRILIDGGLALDLRRWLGEALAAQPVGHDADACGDALWHFLQERLRALLAEQGVGREIFDAVAAMAVADPGDFVARARALQTFGERPEAEQLAAAHKRARNVLRQAAAADDAAPPAAVDPEHFVEAAERQLHQRLQQQMQRQQQHLQSGDYAEALAALAPLQAPVDAFFDAVMVMAEDPLLRRNRLALLAGIDEACRQVADLSLLPG